MEFLIVGAIAVVLFVVLVAVEKTMNKTSDKSTSEPADPKRARNDKGHFIADDPSTPDVNEAWVGGKAPKATKPKKKKTTRKKKTKSKTSTSGSKVGSSGESKLK